MLSGARADTLNTMSIEPQDFKWSSKNPSDQFDVINPATSEIITRIQGGGLAEVESAVAAAHKALNRG
jgi:acyl-CoA reductase-like NAD-dependent aldehyde dehydrogenase